MLDSGLDVFTELRKRTEKRKSVVDSMLNKYSTIGDSEEIDLNTCEDHYGDEEEDLIEYGSDDDSQCVEDNEEDAELDNSESEILENNMISFMQSARQSLTSSRIQHKRKKCSDSEQSDEEDDDDDECMIIEPPTPKKPKIPNIVNQDYNDDPFEQFYPDPAEREAREQLLKDYDPFAEFFQ